MVGNTVNNWFQQFALGQRAVKRSPRPFGKLTDCPEQLEERQVLSAVSGLEALPVSAEVSDMSAAKPKHGKAAVAYPIVSGTWNLAASAIIDGDEPLNFEGNVVITQNKGKIVGVINLDGLPEFTLKGKLNKSNTLALSGKSKFPVAVGDDFRFIRGTVAINYDQGLLSFSGSVNRNIFGHTIEVSLTGSRIQM